MFPGVSGSIRNVLVYGLDGRFNRVVSVKQDVWKGKDAGGRSAGKIVEAVTHWKLLGSSVRPLSFYKGPCIG